MGYGDDSVSWFTRDPVTGALLYGYASDANYTLTAGDLGKTITVVASYTDGGAFDHNVSSSGTAPIQPIYNPSLPNHTVDLNASVNLEMIWVEPGTFTMGQDGVVTPEHNVTLTKGFYLGKYEVTQAQYAAVMSGNNEGASAMPSYFNGSPNRCVEQVSWDDIQVFLTRLNSQQAGNLPEGWVGMFCLPSVDLQWEYACRAGTNTAYSWGDNRSADKMNYSSSGHGKPLQLVITMGIHGAF